MVNSYTAQGRRVQTPILQPILATTSTQPTQLGKKPYQLYISVLRLAWSYEIPV